MARNAVDVGERVGLEKASATEIPRNRAAVIRMIVGAMVGWIFDDLRVSFGTSRSFFGKWDADRWGKR